MLGLGACAVLACVVAICGWAEGRIHCCVGTWRWLDLPTLLFALLIGLGARDIVNMSPEELRDMVAACPVVKLPLDEFTVGACVVIVCLVPGVPEEFGRPCPFTSQVPCRQSLCIHFRGRSLVAIVHHIAPTSVV